MVMVMVAELVIGWLVGRLVGWCTRSEAGCVWYGMVMISRAREKDEKTIRRWHRNACLFDGTHTQRKEIDWLLVGCCSTAHRRRPVVPEADGAWGRRGRDRVILFLDVMDGRHQLVCLGRQGRIEAGKELLGGDQAEVSALTRDGDGRGERGGDLGRHGGRCSVVVIVVVVAAGEVEVWVGLDFPWMRPGGQ